MLYEAYNCILTWMLEEHFELVVGHSEAQLISCIHYEDNGL